MSSLPAQAATTGDDSYMTDEDSLEQIMRPKRRPSPSAHRGTHRPAATTQPQHPSQVASKQRTTQRSPAQRSTSTAPASKNLHVTSSTSQRRGMAARSTSAASQAHSTSSGPKRIPLAVKRRREVRKRCCTHAGICRQNH